MNTPRFTEPPPPPPPPPPPGPCIPLVWSKATEVSNILAVGSAAGGTPLLPVPVFFVVLDWTPLPMSLTLGFGLN